MRQGHFLMSQLISSLQLSKRRLWQRHRRGQFSPNQPSRKFLKISNSWPDEVFATHSSQIALVRRFWTAETLLNHFSSCAKTLPLYLARPSHQRAPLLDKPQALEPFPSRKEIRPHSL
jgi:hypothetical protein